MEIRFLDSSSKDKYLEKHGLSVTDILEEAESQYRYLKSRGKWYPAMRVSDRNVPNALPSLAMPIDSAKDRQWKLGKKELEYISNSVGKLVSKSPACLLLPG